MTDIKVIRTDASLYKGPTSASKQVAEEEMKKSAKKVVDCKKTNKKTK